MQGNLQKQPQIKILRVFSVDERLRLREADIDDVVKTVQGVLPQHVDEDIDVTITLLEKNLKIMADMSLMKKALTHLVRKAMPDYGKFSLTINQVNFDFESLLHSDDSVIGACALIPFAGAGRYVGVDQKMKKKIGEPFFTIETDVNGLGLAMAYRIIKQYEGRIKAEGSVRHDVEVNIYLPLTKLEIVNMMSIPVG